MRLTTQAGLGPGWAPSYSSPFVSVWVCGGDTAKCAESTPVQSSLSPTPMVSLASGASGPPLLLPFLPPLQPQGCHLSWQGPGPGRKRPSVDLPRALPGPSRPRSPCRWRHSLHPCGRSRWALPRLLPGQPHGAECAQTHHGSTGGCSQHVCGDTRPCGRSPECTGAMHTPWGTRPATQGRAPTGQGAPVLTWERPQRVSGPAGSCVLSTGEP